MYAMISLRNFNTTATATNNNKILIMSMILLFYNLATLHVITYISLHLLIDRFEQ